MESDALLDRCYVFVKQYVESEDSLRKSGSPTAIAYWCAKYFIRVTRDGSVKDGDVKLVTKALTGAGVVV